MAFFDRGTSMVDRRLTAAMSLVVFVTAQPGELIDRTMAIVGGQIITLSDVHTAVTLGLVERSNEPDAVVAATLRLVDRLLILREVQRYAPPQPSEAQIDERLASIQARLGSPTLFERTLAAGGFSQPRLRAWIRDDLRIASYLSQRFAAAGTPDEQRDELIEDWIADLRRRASVVELWRAAQ
jgi:hypothetical protein